MIRSWSESTAGSSGCRLGSPADRFYQEQAARKLQFSFLTSTATNKPDPFKAITSLHAA
jgi:hypothetical protein